mmetsp:Transcript_26703/g.70113  ORF Transcript_26703/g.70113 Transcript_26703/m.70113 type:complete len:317 (+) Transcript_26703:1781-2731(+)
MTLHEHPGVAESEPALEDTLYQQLSPHSFSFLSVTSFFNRLERLAERFIVQAIRKTTGSHLQRRNHTAIYQLLQHQGPIHSTRFHLRIRLDAADKQSLALIQRGGQDLELLDKFLSNGALAGTLLVEEFLDVAPRRLGEDLREVLEKSIHGLRHPVLHRVHHSAREVLHLEALTIIQARPAQGFRFDHPLHVLGIRDLETWVTCERRVEDCHEGSTVATVLHHRTFTQQLDNSWWLRWRRKEFHTIDVASIKLHWRVDALGLVEFHLTLKHDAVEQMLDPFIGEVDKHLLEAICGHVFKTEDIKQTHHRNFFWPWH